MILSTDLFLLPTSNNSLRFAHSFVNVLEHEVGQFIIDLNIGDIFIDNPTVLSIALIVAIVGAKH